MLTEWKSTSNNIYTQSTVGCNKTVTICKPGAVGTDIPKKCGVKCRSIVDHWAEGACPNTGTLPWAEVSYYHVHLESWYGYPSDWEIIQKTYPSMAPKSLGNMGYNGFASIYLPRPVQAQAYATEGLALQYYRNWNASWNEPSKYFGLISSVDTSNLMPCNASHMIDDAAMRQGNRRGPQNGGRNKLLVLLQVQWCSVVPSPLRR